MANVLFLVGLLVLLVVSIRVSRKITEGDRFKEGTTEDRLDKLEGRFRTHRRWWQNMMVIGALVLYVSTVGLWVQATSLRVEEESRAGVEQGLEDDLEDDAILIDGRCRFREFVEQFFVELSDGQSQAEDDLKQVKGYSDLPPSTRAFVDALAEDAAAQAIIVEEARRDYIEEFSQEGC